MDWTVFLRQLAPRACERVVEAIAPHFDAAFDRADITTPLRQAHFFARAAVETAGFTTLEEFGSPAYFRRYDFRRDLGNVYPGDGARFRGRGVFQITGRANYRAYGRRIGVDLIRAPALAAAGKPAVDIAVLFWGDKRLNAAADRDDALAVCRAINGGVNGLSEQRIYLARAKAALLEASDGSGQASAPGAGAISDPMPRAQIRSLQKRLAALGYFMVGAPDGLVGSSTVAAISAFQHDKDLPVTGAFDAATMTALWSSDEARPLPRARMHGAPDASPVLAAAARLKAGSSAVAAGGLATWGAGALDQAESARSYWDRVSALLQPFSGLQSLLAAHPLAIASLAALVVAVVADRIVSITIADYRTGRTP